MLVLRCQLCLLKNVYSGRLRLRPFIPVIPLRFETTNVSFLESVRQKAAEFRATSFYHSHLNRQPSNRFGMTHHSRTSLPQSRVKAFTPHQRPVLLRLRRDQRGMERKILGINLMYRKRPPGLWKGQSISLKFTACLFVRCPLKTATPLGPAQANLA